MNLKSELKFPELGNFGLWYLQNMGTHSQVSHRNCMEEELYKRFLYPRVKYFTGLSVVNR